MLTRPRRCVPMRCKPRPRQERVYQAGTRGGATMPKHDGGQTPSDQEFCSWLGAGHRDTINDVIRRAAEKWPDRVYLDFSGETWTYQQVYQQATAYAAGLADLGVQRGDT